MPRLCRGENDFDTDSYSIPLPIPTWFAFMRAALRRRVHGLLTLKPQPRAWYERQPMTGCSSSSDKLEKDAG
jgi:hypothetical protein